MTSASTTRQRMARAVPTVVETLENRRLFTVSVEGGVLVVRGTDGLDDVQIIADRYRTGFEDRLVSTFSVKESGVYGAPITYTRFDPAELTGIRVELGAG